MTEPTMHHSCDFCGTEATLTASEVGEGINCRCEQPITWRDYNGDPCRAPIRHFLKCFPDYFRDIKLGYKTFEIRRDDRDFQEQDWLVLQEWEPVHGFTGHQLSVEVLYVMRDEERFGLMPGFAILAIRTLEEEKA